MHRIVYISGETARLGRPDLEALLTESRGRNEQLGITGLLLYHHGNFMQILEGEEADIRGVFESIRRDPRHYRVITVLDEPIGQRDFPGWSMAFREINLNAEAPPPGFSEFLLTPWQTQDLTQHTEEVRRFLRLFVEVTQ